jgi:hypothetical protein
MGIVLCPPVAVVIVDDTFTGDLLCPFTRYVQQEWDHIHVPKQTTRSAGDEDGNYEALGLRVTIWVQIMVLED